MSEFIAVSFADKFQAEEVLINLLKLEEDHLLDLEDAVTAFADAEGKVKVRSYHDLVKPGDLSNELWGGLLSAIVFHRSLALVDDSLAGVIDESFLTAAQASLQPNTSLLFVIVRHMEPEQVLQTFAETGGKILRTAIADEHLDR